MACDVRAPKGYRKAWNGGSMEAALAAADKARDKRIAAGIAVLCDECGGKGGTIHGICIQCHGQGELPA